MDFIAFPMADNLYYDCFRRHGSPLAGAWWLVCACLTKSGLILVNACQIVDFQNLFLTHHILLGLDNI